MNDKGVIICFSQKCWPINFRNYSFMNTTITTIIVKSQTKQAIFKIIIKLAIMQNVQMRAFFTMRELFIRVIFTIRK